jgi:hypothetical protein
LAHFCQIVKVVVVGDMGAQHDFVGVLLYMLTWYEVSETWEHLAIVEEHEFVRIMVAKMTLHH